MRLKLTLEYDGTKFSGWAVQPDLRTVEKAVREALEWVYSSSDNLVVAGRTDTGVHALGQVVSVDVEGGPADVQRAPEALNTALPDDVAVRAAEVVAPDFHARHSALGPAAIATASGVAEHDPRSRSTAASGFHSRSTTARSATPPIS